MALQQLNAGGLGLAHQGMVEARPLHHQQPARLLRWRAGRINRRLHRPAKAPAVTHVAHPRIHQHLGGQIEQLPLHRHRHAAATGLVAGQGLLLQQGHPQPTSGRHRRRRGAGRPGAHNHQVVAGPLLEGWRCHPRQTPIRVSRAAVTSAWRISASPTSTASAPALCTRSRSSRLASPDSLTSRQPLARICSP